MRLGVSECLIEQITGKGRIIGLGKCCEGMCIGSKWHGQCTFS